MHSRQRAVSRGLAVAAAMFLLAVNAPAQVARVFLSGTGDDAQDCSNAATPCRSLQGAIDQVQARGEVIVLSSGGFGTATISKSVTINAPDGIVAFNARTITVNITASDTVVIRGLAMNGAFFGDSYGINFSSAGTLVVEDSAVDGFAVASVYQHGAKSAVVLNNSEFRNTPNLGVYTSSTTTDPMYLTIQGCRFVNNAYAGVNVTATTYAVIKNSVMTHGRFGVFAVGSATGDPRVVVDNCVIAHNTMSVDAAGIRAQDLAAQPYDVAVRVTNSDIYGNTTGLYTVNAAIVSYGTNHLWGNSTNGAFSSTVPEQ